MATKKTPTVDVVETDAVEALLNVETQIKTRLINRDSQVRAMLLAVVAEQNLILDGPPGVAKTRMGTLFAESVVGDEDFCFFKTQMMKNTLPEQLFGPINVSKMRSESPVYEYATEQMLPQAHFAILEEVYRASEMVLSSMLTILNERQFHNGGKLVACPLISAIGTTNFVVGGEEIEAFNDRWLMRCMVPPLKSQQHRLEMLRMTLSSERKPLTAGISLNQIRELHEKRHEVEIPSPILDLYEQLATNLSKSNGLSIKITDRRLVQTLELIRSAAVLRNSDEANEDDLFVTEYGLTCKGNTSDESLFGTAYTAVIGNYAKIKNEQKQLLTIIERANQYEAAFDSSMDKGKAKRLADVCRTMLNAMSQRTETYISATNEAEFKRVFAKVDRTLRDAIELVESSKLT